jgi:hypothetical protein
VADLVVQENLDVLVARLPEVVLELLGGALIGEARVAVFFAEMTLRRVGAGTRRG